MARKDLLKGLMDQNAAAQGGAPAEDAKTTLPRYSTGSIGAVSQSIAELKSRAVAEIDTDLIFNSKLRDRLDDLDIDALALSIQDNGQQVPVLLRPVEVRVGVTKYEIVYGRRRVAALRKLGKPVKALIRTMTDRQLILAQGQENAARKDLSFIEKANFARQMRDLGYERKTICDALHLDKTVISRMLSIADSIPLDLIEAIGAAPSVGRDRWLQLAGRINGQKLQRFAKGADSDARFEAVFDAALPRKPSPPKPADVQDVALASGTHLARVKRGKKKTEITFDDRAFADWLATRLDRLHAEWSDTSGDKG